MKLDDKRWNECHPDDIWVYDKLILSRKLGYTCGPGGVLTPHPDYYIVRPITNIDGMGFGAKIEWIDDSSYHIGKGSPLDWTDELIPPGYFWCEIFEGRHLSVDYVDKKQVLCVEGFRLPGDPLYKWHKWIRVDDVIPFPDVLQNLHYDGEINCEFIGGNLIEVHLRRNPDFVERPNVKELYPVWEGGTLTPPPGMKLKRDPDWKRWGFWIK